MRIVALLWALAGCATAPTNQDVLNGMRACKGLGSLHYIESTPFGVTYTCQNGTKSKGI